MSEFRPEGYVPTIVAVRRAAEFWDQARYAAFEKAASTPSETKPRGGVERLAAAFSQPPGLPEAFQIELQDIVAQAALRLRNLLHQGELTAYYFDNFGCNSLPREFWATAQADGVLESGDYLPYGTPSQWYETRPKYPVFLVQGGLNLLLSDLPAQKRAFPRARMPELVKALHELGDLLTRKEQLTALRSLPQFAEFMITHALFREASRKAGPRQAGRKSRQK